MTFHDLHNFGRTHIGPISIFGSNCGCTGRRNSTPNKCSMVEALPAEAVVNQASVGGESTWERDQLAIKGTQRFDINVHDFGTDTVGGPICGLQMAAA